MEGSTLTNIPCEHGFLKKLYIYGASNGAVLRIHGNEIVTLKNDESGERIVVDFVQLLKMAHAREYFGRLLSRTHAEIYKMWDCPEVTEVYRLAHSAVGMTVSDTMLMLINEFPVSGGDFDYSTHGKNFTGLNCSQFSDMTLEDSAADIRFEFEYA